MEPLDIGARSRDGLLEIADKSWDHNGTMRVTVRELIGGRTGWRGGLPIERMRRLARRALAHPEQTRSSRVIRKEYAPSQGCWFVTFAVSRLDNR